MYIGMVCIYQIDRNESSHRSTTKEEKSKQRTTSAEAEVNKRATTNLRVGVSERRDSEGKQNRR